MTRNFMSMISALWDQDKFVCVGLDTDDKKVPSAVENDLAGGKIIYFNTAIIDATKDLVCAYKPNLAFYIQHGQDGIYALRTTIEYIHREAPHVPVILDGKFADIGNTNKGYAAFAFDICGADAITIHAYHGHVAMKPFLDYKDKGIIVVARTSNKGAGEFQDFHSKLNRLFEYVAENVADPTKWNYNGNCCVVAGATYPEELGEIRKIVGDMPILIPGIGAQGGDVEATVKAGMNSKGQGMIINSSRGIIFASDGPDFAKRAREETMKLHDLINSFRNVT